LTGLVEEQPGILFPFLLPIFPNRSIEGNTTAPVEEEPVEEEAETFLEEQ
jgi:hypothetical protein